MYARRHSSLKYIWINLNLLNFYITLHDPNLICSSRVSTRKVKTLQIIPKVWIVGVNRVQKFKEKSHYSLKRFFCSNGCSSHSYLKFVLLSFCKMSDFSTSPDVQPTIMLNLSRRPGVAIYSGVGSSIKNFPSTTGLHVKLAVGSLSEASRISSIGLL